MNTMEHRVRERAYYIWEGEGRVIGHADAHWIQAEAELAGAGIVIEAAAVPTARKASKTAKAAAPRTAAPKAAAKASPKAAAVKAPAKTKRAPRPAEAGIALH